MHLTTIIFILLTAYSILITIMVIKEHKNDDPQNDTYEINRLISTSQLDKEKQIKYLLELNRIKNESIPWYYRSISAIGVIVFLSMVTATAIQTVKANFENYKSYELQAKIDELNKREIKSNEIIKNITDLIFSIHARTGNLPQHSKEILEYRLEILEKREEITKESYNIAMLLRDYRKAVRILNFNNSLFNDTNPVDQINLSQYYYLIGNLNKSTELINKIKHKISSLSPYWQKQYIALEYLLSTHSAEELELYVKRLSRILQVNRKEAEMHLLKEAKRLKEAAITLDR